MTKLLEWVVHTHCLHFLRFNKHFLKSIYEVLCQKFSYTSSHLILINILWAGNYYLYFRREKYKESDLPQGFGQDLVPGSCESRVGALLYCLPSRPAAQSNCWPSYSSCHYRHPVPPSTPLMTLLRQSDWWPVLFLLPALVQALPSTWHPFLSYFLSENLIILFFFFFPS